MSRPVALITGASSGIGRAIAAQLSPTHHILVGGRDRNRLNAVVGELDSAEPFAVDLRDPAAVTAAITEIARLDTLIHSAGVAAWGPLSDSTPSQWDEVLSLNVTAPATLTASLLPALRAAKGTVVFINSGAGLHASPNWSIYAASKFALTAVADALRAEEAGRVRVISVHPGRVATPMQAELNRWEGREYHPERYLSADDVATTVVAALRLPHHTSVNSLQIRPTN